MPATPDKCEQRKPNSARNDSAARASFASVPLPPRDSSEWQVLRDGEPGCGLAHGHQPWQESTVFASHSRFVSGIVNSRGPDPVGLLACHHIAEPVER